MLRQPNCVPDKTRFYDTGGYKKGYNVEGHGRDTYVQVDNGGFTIAHSTVKQLQPGTIYYPQHDVLRKLGENKSRS